MTKNYQKLSIVLGLGLFFVGMFILALVNSYSYSDNDLGWHLRIGNDIAVSGVAPTINYYNYTLAGDKWVDHEWLLNLAMFKVFEFGGFSGLHIIFALLVLLIVYLAWQRTREFNGKSIAGSVISLALIALAIWASRPHLGIRVQEFALLLILLLLYAIDLFPLKTRLFCFLPLVFIFWANIHGSFILGLGILFAYSVYLWAQPLLRRIAFLHNLLHSKYSKQDKIISSVVLSLSLLGTLINPYGVKLYAFLGGYTNTFYMKHISEWQGQSSIPLYYPQLVYLAIFVSFVGIFLYINRGNKNNQSLWDWGVSLLFFVLALRSRRHFPIFAFASLPLLVLAVKQMIAGAQLKLSNRLKKIITVLMIAAVLLAFISLAIRLPVKQGSINDGCETKYPCAAVSFLKQQTEMQDLRLLNEFNWGGYLLYAYPERQIFIDGRMPQASYKEHTILEEYSQFKVADTDFRALLTEHDIGLVLLYSSDRQVKISKFEQLFLHIEPEEVIVDSYLRDYLSYSPAWEEIYRDNLSIVFKRKK
ncbi:MAG: hypothetical protein Q8Q67_00920 [bacterium]|nr:hypothetical protein [bacterium]